MYYRFLDGWDEKRAVRSDQVKLITPFEIGANLAFGDASGSTSLAQLIDLSSRAAISPGFFENSTVVSDRVFVGDDKISFCSEVITDVVQNNQVVVRVTKGGDNSKALLVFHHWNASKWNTKLSNYVAKSGVTVFEMAMPYHFDRSRAKSGYADYMLGSNLGRTLQSMRQAVLDARRLIMILRAQGFKEFSVLGMSLGSWVAGLVAANDRSVSKAALFLTGGSLAEMVWTGRATKALRASIEPHLELEELKKAWSPLDLANHLDGLRRKGLAVYVVSAKRDTVVLPDISRKFVADLVASGGNIREQKLNCGHYSLALPPHILFAGHRLTKFLAES